MNKSVSGGASNANSGNRLPVLTRDMKVLGVGAGINVNFGTEAGDANSFNLGTRTSANPTSFVVENISVTRAGATASAIYGNGTSAANSAGWNITIANFTGVGTTRLVNVAGATATLAGTVNWIGTDNNTKVNVTALNLANGAQVSLSKSTGGVVLCSLVNGLQVGDGASLTLNGGGPAVNVSRTTQAYANFGNGARLNISNATNGILMPISPTNDAANYSRYVFGPNSSTAIAVADTALRGTGVEFQANATATITGTSSSATLVNLRGISTRIPYYFNAIDGADVTLRAVGGNALDVCGTETSPAQANIRVLNGSHLTATGAGTGGGTENAVITLMGNSGASTGYTVSGGSTLEAHSTATSGGYPALLQQANGTVFNATGEGSRLILTQNSSPLRITAVLG